MAGYWRRLAFFFFFFLFLIGDEPPSFNLAQVNPYLSHTNFWLGLDNGRCQREIGKWIGRKEKGIFSHLPHPDLARPQPAWSTWPYSIAASYSGGSPFLSPLIGWGLLALACFTALCLAEPTHVWAVLLSIFPQPFGLYHLFQAAALPGAIWKDVYLFKMRMLFILVIWVNTGLSKISCFLCIFKYVF